jgi:peptidyl-prolyl cis-trans isomerase B (cyclophilin B)
VENFQNLVSEGFYDGLIFHRVVENFCVQGGGFDKTGTLKPTDRIPAEFFAAGGKNHLLHRTGVVSMARATDYNSASSQFFFTMSDDYTQALDGKYAAFGYVVSGWELVEELARVETGKDDKPTATYFIEKATFVTEKN